MKLNKNLKSIYINNLTDLRNMILKEVLFKAQYGGKPSGKKLITYGRLHNKYLQKLEQLNT